MISFVHLTLLGLATNLCFPGVFANSDKCTGSLWDYRPSDEWLAKNPPAHVTEEIQVSECALNTRLHFPQVQAFAWFSVDHTKDGYHGCPYGRCMAFINNPGPNDLVPDFTNHHSFWWHGTGGVPGCLVKPISDPQRGWFGFEASLSGKFQVGKAPESNEQTEHDSNYPTYASISSKWTIWTDSDRSRFQGARQSHSSSRQGPTPIQPKCGRPDEENKDPGEDGPSGHDKYIPAPAIAYIAPDGSDSGSNTNLTSPFDPNNPGSNSDNGGSKGKKHGNKNGSGKPTSHKHCSIFCDCLDGCQGQKECRDKCQRRSRDCTEEIHCCSDAQ